MISIISHNANKVKQYTPIYTNISYYLIFIIKSDFDQRTFF